MHFSRIVSFFVVFMTATIFALAKPAAIDKRDAVSTAQDIVNNLKSQTDTILPQIQSAPQTAEALTPLLQSLTDAFNAAKSNVSTVSTRAVTEMEKRQLDAIGSLLGGVITDLAGVLGGIPLVGLGLASILTGLDTAVVGLVTGLDGIVTGLGAVLSGILGAVSGLSGILNILGLVGILGIL